MSYRSSNLPILADAVLAHAHRSADSFVDWMALSTRMSGGAAGSDGDGAAPQVCPGTTTQGRVRAVPGRKAVCHPYEQGQ